MKKLQAVTLLPFFALTSCAGTTQPPMQENQLNQEAEQEIPSDVEEIIDQIELESDISMTQTTLEDTSAGQVQIIDIQAEYVWPNGQDSVFTATLEVLDGIVVEVSGLEGKMGVQAEFAKQFPDAIIGKPLKGLQVDGITGASLTSMAVNQFLNTVNQ